MEIVMESLYQVPATSCSDTEHRIFWAKVISDQKASGTSIKKFCRQHQLNFSALHYWKYRKQKIKAAHVCSGKSNNNAARFIPLQIAEDMPNDECHKNEPAHSKPQEIQIVFKNNHKLILPLIIPEASLLLIVKVVAGLQC